MHLSKIRSAVAKLITTKLVQRSGLSFALRVFGVGINFLITVLFARALGAEQYGVYVFWITVAGLTATLLSMGVPSLVLRELAAARGSNDAQLQSRVINYGNTATWGIAATLVTAGLLVTSFFSTPSTQPLWLSVSLLAFISMAVGSFNNYANALLMGFERIVTGLSLNLVAPFMTLLCAIVIIVQWQNAATASTAMLGVLSASLIAVVINKYIVSKSVPYVERRPSPGLLPRSQYSAWLLMGFAFALNQVLTNAITQVDIIMLGVLASAEATAHYQVASRLSYFAAFFFGSIAGILAPTIARLHSSGSKEELLRTVHKAGILAFAGTAILSAAILLFGEQLLAIFGHAFLQAHGITVILILSWLLHAAFGFNHTVLTMTGGIKFCTIVLVGATIANVLLNAIMIPRLGAEGAAYASLLSTLGFTVIEWFYIKHQFGSYIDVISAVRHRYLSSARSGTKGIYDNE